MYAACKIMPDGMRYTSEMVVYDEKFLNGNLVCRYINGGGQILPQMHMHDSIFNGDCPVFSITIQGECLDGGWNLVESKTEAEKGILVFRHVKFPLQVILTTSPNGEGWFTREMKLKNLSRQPLILEKLYPFQGIVFRHVFKNGVFSYDPAECGLTMDQLYEAGYANGQVWGHEGDFSFHPLEEKGLLYDSGFHGRSGWSRPAYFLRDRMTGQLFNVEFAYSGNWHMQLTPEKTVNGMQLRHAIGFSTPEGEALRVLDGEEELNVPAVHFTFCAKGMNALTESRHAFIRHTILPKDDPIGKSLIEANHRGYLCDAENEPGIIQDMEVAAKAGVELYVIDAGWYGCPPNNWFNNVGDWFSAPWLPNDLYPIIQRAHELGMKFGLWMELEGAGSNSLLRKEHPEFIMRRYGEPVADGRALNMTDPKVVAWVEDQICQVISRYQLDMFRVDHNHHMLQGGTMERDGVVENLTWRYYDNLHAMFDRIRARFPHVSFQNCAAGGGRLDLGNLTHFHHTEISDWARPPRDIKLFTGMLSQLPPEIQLRICGTEVCEHVQSSDMLACLHSILQGRMILRGISPTVEELNPILIDLIREKTDLYKKHLRPILTGDCLVTIHAPLNGVLGQWDYAANEYALPDHSAAFQVVQRLSACWDGQLSLRFSHVNYDDTYQVTLDRKGQSFTLSGKKLALQGLPLQLDHMLETELILIKRC